MKGNEKIRALIDAYIEVCRENYEDTQILMALSDIFDINELVELGYADFINECEYETDKE
ncbi:MAG: hypothetical protein FWD58_11470 [Firmicutes bacterium]|nr:hypothetical protein [Bacillota bacterium]